MSDMGSHIEPPALGGVSRRRVLQGAAWSVPAVMVAQMPVWASNGTPEDVTVDVVGQVCKFPGNASTDIPKGYVFSLAITNNTSNVDINVDIDAMFVNNIEYPIIQLVRVDENGVPDCSIDDPETTYLVPRDSVVQVAVYIQEFPSSPSTTVRVEFSWVSVDESQSDEGFSERGFTGSTWTGGCRPFGIDQNVWDDEESCPNAT